DLHIFKTKSFLGSVISDRQPDTMRRRHSRRFRTQTRQLRAQRSSAKEDHRGRWPGWEPAAGVNGVVLAWLYEEEAPCTYRTQRPTSRAQERKVVPPAPSACEV